MVKLTISKVAPTGTKKTIAFVNRGGGRGGVEEIELPVYPSQHVSRGEALRAVRVRSGLSLREAAQVLGISGVEMSSLEHGSCTVPDEEWASITEAIRKGKS